MSNPKFLPVEKRVQYNIRLTPRLIEKYNSYADLTGNTTTNIINTVLTDFISDKAVLNDYLDNVGGVVVKIPYAINQKFNLTATKKNAYDKNLLNYSDAEKIKTIDTDGFIPDIYETYFAELFEVKKIPNNLDVIVDGSYTANKKTLLFNKNATHSGIELFVYNITEIVFADLELINELKLQTFENALYCLYFEVGENDDVAIYLIDYLKAINLASASGNDELKDTIIACVKDLKEIDDYANNYSDIIENRKSDVSFKSEEDYYLNSESVYAEIEKKGYAEMESDIKTIVSNIADKYNSNNIIPFGSDIFSRLAVKELEKEPDYFDELINAKIDEKVAKLEKENESLKAEIKKAIDFVKGGE